MTDNPFTQPLRKTMNDPRFDWTRNQRMRRRLVVAYLLLIAAQPVVLWVVQSPFVLVAMLLPLVFLMGSINASIRGLSELRSRDLDEREADTHNRVYVHLYWPGLALGTTGALISGLFVQHHDLLLIGAGLSCFFLAIALPPLWLAWSLPDEPGND